MIGKHVILYFLCTLFLSSFSIAQESIKVVLPIRNYLAGERAQVHLITEGVALNNLEREKKIDGIVYTLIRNLSLSSAKNGLARNIYSYSFTVNQTGVYKTPSFEVEQSGKVKQLERISFQVHDLDQFDFKTLTLGKDRYPYYSATFIEKAEAYENEALYCEVRYIIPNSLRLQQWGIADAEHDTALYAWKLNPPESLSRSRNPYELSKSILAIKGVSHTGIAYQSNLFGTSSGMFTFGPVSSNSSFKHSTMISQGFFQIGSKRALLVAGETDVTVKPLPPHPPANFSGNVGSFHMETHEPANKSTSLGESIEVSFTISGKGNFLTLQQPAIIDPDAWDIIDFSQSLSEDTQDSISNSVQYNFLIAPKKKVTQTPQIAFNFFDPSKIEYKELISQSYPLTFTTSNSSQASLTSPPIVNQQDILGLIEARSGVLPSSFRLPRFWHVFPAILFLLIVSFWAIQKIKIRRMANVENIERKQALRKFQKQELSDKEFLRRAGGFVEKWSHSDISEDAQTVLDERDRQCFQPTEDSLVNLGSERKSQIMTVLKKLCLILLCFTLIDSSEAEEPEVKSTEFYQQELEQYQGVTSKSSDHFYNIGVCYYRLNQLGNACLYFHRALSLDETHREAKQNLRFLSTRLMHPSQPEPKELSQYIAYFSSGTYKDLSFIGLWGVLISVALLLCIKLSPRWVWGTLGALLLSSILCIVAFTAYTSYPKSLHFAPFTELAVVTSPENILLTEPRTPITEDDKIILSDVPEGSLCQVLNHHATWSYVELSSSIRGWIRSECLTKIQELDQDPPEPAPL